MTTRTVDEIAEFYEGKAEGHKEGFAYGFIFGWIATLASLVAFHILSKGFAA